MEWNDIEDLLYCHMADSLTSFRSLLKVTLHKHNIIMSLYISIIITTPKTEWLWVRHCSKTFMHVNLYSTTPLIILSSSRYQSGNRRGEVKALAPSLQLVSDGVRIPSRAVWLQSLCKLTLPSSPRITSCLSCFIFGGAMSPLLVCFLPYDHMSSMKTGLACFAHSHPQSLVVSNMAQEDVAITCWRKKGIIQSRGTTRFPSDAFIKSATAHKQACHDENETLLISHGGEGVLLHWLEEGATAWRWRQEHSLESRLSGAEHKQIIT